MRGDILRDNMGLPAAENWDTEIIAQQLNTPSRRSWRRTIKIYCRITTSIRFASPRNCVPRTAHPGESRREAPFNEKVFDSSFFSSDTVESEQLIQMRITILLFYFPAAL